ncbi:microtubule-associated protein 10 [Brachionichthys hirsutus]|uniref:microtubule-associated protein 10 n=1 Tax=Brachionichthys hirsutus TaxID=412623 RepID=UPI00360542DD
MSGQQNDDNDEILFSFEFMVERVRIEEQSDVVSDQLALGVRLLDFPTLLIYQPRGSSRGGHVFNRGKCCFFRMNVHALHAQLRDGPLHAMVLDVKEDIPRLVGTSLISLSSVMDRVRQDVTQRGAAAASSHGERGVTGLCDVMGGRIGSISLSYRLLTLGASVLPLITDSQSTSEQKGSGGTNESPESVPPECGNVCSSMLKSDVRRKHPDWTPSNNSLTPEDNPDSHVSVAVKAEHKATTQSPPSPKNESRFEEDLTVFCPPHLFYDNSAEEKCKKEAGDWKRLNPDSEPFPFDEARSEDEMSGISKSPPFTKRAVKHDVKINGQTSGVTPNACGEALRQLPLLNALLVELSQLSGQNPRQPLSVHPNLSWIYRPASPEPSVGHGTPAGKARHGSGPHLKNTHPARKCPAPAFRPSSVKDAEEEALMKGTSHRKKLTYGTTKSFKLRLKLRSSRGAKRCEAKTLIENKTRGSTVKGKATANNQTMSRERKVGLNHGSVPSENAEEVTRGAAVGSTLQGTVTFKKERLNQEVHGEQHGYAPRERDCNLIHVPGGDDDDGVGKTKDGGEHLGASGQSESPSDGHGDRTPSSGSGSPKPSSSESGEEDEEEADYTDDFNSLESGDAFSPDPASSPERSGSQTPRSPVRPDFSNAGSSDSDAVLPQPIEASPQRTLGGTYIITPRAQTSAPGVSSADSDGSASLQSTRCRKQPESGRMGKRFGTDSSPSSQGQDGESAKDGGPGQGISDEAMSSIEPQGMEELEDELGSLDFRNQYQHISKLVACKLPGYTI